MNCPACAETIPNNTKICPFCKTNMAEFTRDMAEERAERPRATKSQKSKSTPLVLILGGVIGALLLCGGVLLALLLPAVQQAREAARRTQSTSNQEQIGREQTQSTNNLKPIGPEQTLCKDNLKRIGLALHNYHDVYGTFPPAVTSSANGQPMHSWRVLLLPFLGERAMYEQYHFDEPWDSPANSAVTSGNLSVFACPSNPNGPKAGHTHYVAVVGLNAAFHPNKGIAVKDMRDGPSRTIMVVEAKNSGIHWAEPRDFSMSSPATPGDTGMSSWHTDVFAALFGDGSVRFLSGGMTPADLEGLSTIGGGEDVAGF